MCVFPTLTQDPQKQHIRLPMASAPQSVFRLRHVKLLYLKFSAKCK